MKRKFDHPETQATRGAANLIATAEVAHAGAALALVDEHLLVGVRPPIQSAHLSPKRVVAYLIATYRHELSVRLLEPLSPPNLTRNGSFAYFVG